MWFGYGGYARIGYANSTDGISWTAYASNPVLSKGSGGSFDDYQVSTPIVLKEGSAYRMWYLADDGSKYRVGYAVSSDKVNWTKYAGNPVITVGSAGSHDSMRAWEGFVMNDDSTYKMWFASENESGAHGFLGLSLFGMPC